MNRIMILTLVIGSGLPLADADETAVRKSLSDYVSVLNQRAVDRIGEFWTEEGTHVDRETGLRTTGRKAIQADIAEVLKSQEAFKLSATVDRVRFVTPDVAKVEGETTVVASDGEPVVATFTATLVQRGDRWLLDSIDEMARPQPAAGADALRELSWLVGDWVDDSGETKVTTTFRWTANDAFLLRSFRAEGEAGVAVTGTQVIGWDPVIQQIRSWTFQSDGTFGESTWSRKGGRWSSKAVQTLASGEVASGTYVMERDGDDAFTVQLAGHEIGGQPQPAGPVVRVVRLSAPPATAAESQN